MTVQVKVQIEFRSYAALVKNTAWNLEEMLYF